jgi:hypothetical protein
MEDGETEASEEDGSNITPCDDQYEDCIVLEYHKNVFDLALF